MMVVSPWFYTNLPQYKKNWMWPDKLMLTWADRWTQVLTLQPQQPDYVEIISWNDFGEVSPAAPHLLNAPSASHVCNVCSSTIDKPDAVSLYR